jgi:maleamate amidohydrolase
MAAPAWWEFVPEDERAVYERAGFRGDEPLGPAPALLVIDATRAFTGSRPLPVEQAIDEYPTSCGEAAWTALAAIRRLLDGFRAAGLPVVYTRRDEQAQRATRKATKRVAGPAREGANEFVAEIAPREHEWICEKARASAFYGTPLEAFLRIRDVRTVVLCGGATSGCVRASAVDAFSAGFNVVVADDACFDRARHPHLANLFDINAKYGTVAPADAVLAQIPGSGH